MPEDLREGASEIESLLGERHQLRQWLERLDSTPDAPQRVRDRVRADYEGRLTEVVARLRGFTATLTASLTELRSRLGEVEAYKAEIEEEQAEAQLRHAVGEYVDEQWQGMDSECRSKLDRVAGEIGGLSGEIDRLEEVLGLIVPPEPKPQTHRRKPEDLQVHVIEPEMVSLQPQAPPGGDPVAVQPMDQGMELAETQERVRQPEAPRFTPRGGPEAPSAPGASPRDRSGRMLRFPPQQPSQRAPETPGNVDEMTFLKSVALEGPESDDPQARQRGAASAKTLKCTECGAMNRPTEWYCERCGAELAAL